MTRHLQYVGEKRSQSSAGSIVRCHGANKIRTLADRPYNKRRCSCLARLEECVGEFNHPLRSSSNTTKSGKRSPRPGGGAILRKRGPRLVCCRVAFWKSLPRSRPFARSIVIPRDRFWASYYLYAVADRRRMENRRGRSHRWTDPSLVRSLGGISDDFAVVDWQGRAALKNGGLAFRFLQSRTRFMMQ